MGTPYVQTSDRLVNQLQSNIVPQIQQLASSPIANPQLFQKVSLVSGMNTINIGLSQPLQGWVIVRLRASATFYDGQDTNQNPSGTLILFSTAPVVVDLLVF